MLYKHISTKIYKKEPLHAHKNWHYGTIGIAKKRSGGKQFKGGTNKFQAPWPSTPCIFCYSDCPIRSIFVSLQGFFFVQSGLNVFLGHKNPT